ncbi:MAG: RNA polymerase sigma factor [Candidatus Cyclonatronum sp.]|uniref:RNA polymerase sigma factor n=1 Tax=Cyclonatronum sp. TaxID=3024185 RepID=UPI0025C3BEC1|nr:RNA polymerase sigma factor [Cyclonatronum sp.]MCH8487269.1 RNA polymerase sigma factor [Cyclonatronum sp.]
MQTAVADSQRMSPEAGSGSGSGYGTAEQPGVDVRLVGAAATGDEQAFAALMRQWRVPLFRFLLRLTGGQEEAHELVQRSFIKMHQRLSTLGDAARFRPWLYQIALNQFRDWYRSRKREQLQREALAGEAQPASDLPHRDAPPLAELEEQDRNRLLQQAIGRLSPEQREVLVLKTWQGLSFPEIAQALGIPENTAKSRLYSSYRALAAIFDDMNLTFNDLWP